MSTTRRALLLGCQTHGLEGVEGDVERMSTALGARGFALSRYLGADATRDGVRSAYEKLIADTNPGDAVCIYYSGHGGRVPNPYPSGPRFLHYIVPTDHKDGVFRGVMSFELSSLLARLTAKSPNVTVILDCCHAGQMSRGDPVQKIGELTLTPKVFAGQVSEAELRALLDGVNAERALAEADVESNPHAVRLVATEPQCSAYEGKLQNVSSGIFTNALLDVLARAGDRPVSWGSVILQVRERVIAMKKEQRPDVEGPRRRELWGLSMFADERPLSVFWNGPQARLRGGALFGAVPGARFGVMPAGSEKYVAGAAVGEAVVVESDGSTSPVDIAAKGAAPLAGPGLVAFPLSVPFRKCRVGLGPELPPEIGGVFANSRYLEPVALEPHLPTIRMAGANLLLRDASGVELVSAPVARAADVLERLEILARAEDLRAFAPGLLDADLNIELGRIVNQAPVKMTTSEPLCVGDRQYISVKNDGFDPVFIAVFGVDPRYTVRLLSRRAPRGFRLRPNESLPLGQGPDGKWVGYPVSWPDDIAADEPLRESIVVIAADDEQDFPLLTTADAYDLKLAEVQSTPRGATPARGQRGGAQAPRLVGSEYKLQCFEYLVSPKPRPG